MKQTRHWAEMQESGIVWGMRLLLKIYLLCGRRILQVFLYPVVSYYWLVNKRGRQASQDYLARVAGFSPSLKPGGSYRHFICFANALIDKLAAWSGSVSRADVEYHGRDAMMAQIASGRGAVLLGSHLGNLDVCRVLAHLDKDIRINVLVHTKHAEKFNRLLSRYNEASSMNLIQVTEITAATSVLLNDKIDNGELVIITADRTPVSEQPRVLKAKFLGEEAPFPQGPFILAALLKCPVYTLFCLKQRGRHVIYFDHFSDGLKFPRKTREQAMQVEIQRYAGRLQDYCLKEPLQWFNFFDFWHG
ncbi:LpxL/LpxP family acyltransferase [Methylobacter sp. sgz302048]|uniref:LpxL/LpxP family acyltransferase n=1 Tax=Methylobacter sp. sgz302048 TaxID=3455945 RepID=UPI003FA0E844